MSNKITLRELSEQVTSIAQNQKFMNSRLATIESQTQMLAFDAARNKPKVEAKKSEAPSWRKEQPSNLRNLRVIDKEEGFFRDEQFHYVIQERWERVHHGEIIDREWRDLDTWTKYLPD